MKALPLSHAIHAVNPGDMVRVGKPGEEPREVIVASVKSLNRYVIVSFQGISTAEAAACFRGAVVSTAGDLPILREGEFFYDQIIGLSVFTLDGDLVGRVEEIIETGSNDVYVVRKDDKEVLIPAIRDVIYEIDLMKKRIVVTPMEGLLT